MTKRKKGTVLIPKRNKVGLENAFHWYMFSVPLGDSQLIFPAVRWKIKINTRIHTIRSKVLMYMCSCCSKAQEKCETIHFFYFFRTFFFFGKSATYTYILPSTIAERCKRKDGWLIQCPSAVLRSAKTRDLNVLYRELIIVCNLFIHINILFGVNDDLLLGLHSDDLCVAIGLQKWWYEKWALCILDQ